MTVATSAYDTGGIRYDHLENRNAQDVVWVRTVILVPIH